MGAYVPQYPSRETLNFVLNYLIRFRHDCLSLIATGHLVTHIVHVHVHVQYDGNYFPQFGKECQIITGPKFLEE